MINVLDWIPLAHKLTNKRYKQFRHKYSYQDLFQIACVGLIKASKNFNKNRGVKFTTYAIPYVDGYILSQIRNDKWFLGSREYRLQANAPFSLDNVCYADSGREGTTFLDRINIENEINVEYIALRIAINNLPRELKTIVNLTYFCDLKQREIGDILGMHQVQVSRELKKALNILRRQIA